MTTRIKDLLARASAKTNDSSEEKHVAEFFKELLEDAELTTDLMRAEVVEVSAHQMRDFCEMLAEEATEDIADLTPPRAAHKPIEFIFLFGEQVRDLQSVRLSYFIFEMNYEQLLKDPPEVVEGYIFNLPHALELMQQAHIVKIKAGNRTVVVKDRWSNRPVPFVDMT